MPVLQYTDAKSSLHVYPLIAHRTILGFCSVFVDINSSMLWCWHLIEKYIQRQQLACNNVIYGLDSVVSIHSHTIHLHHTHCMYTLCLHMWLITMFVAVQPLHPISPSHLASETTFKLACRQLVQVSKCPDTLVTLVCLFCYYSISHCVKLGLCPKKTLK